MRLCLIVPVRDEERSLPAMLASIAEQTYPRGLLRLIVPDNGSVDGSAALVQAFLTREGIAGGVVRVAQPSIPVALNAALSLAVEGEAIVRLDAHTTYAPEYLASIAAAFERYPVEVWCVGGSQVPAPERGPRALVVALMTNRFGLGGAAFRAIREPGPVAGVYLGAWRPGVLQRLGGFDPAWRANEDAELAARLTEAGGEIWWVPALSSYQVTRGPLATLRQWSRYGFWRARTLKRHPRAFRLRHLAPPLALATFFALVLSPVRLLVLPLVLLEALAIIASRARDEAPLVTLAAIVYFPLAHAAFACGLLTGLVRATPSRPRAHVSQGDATALERGMS
jgi:succinoglycan biosynthesis protein ExoA